MALLNKLFSSKKKVTKQQGYVHQNKNESNWRPFNFSKNQVRILLFRECDWLDRKLLFDSNAVQKVTLESPNTNKFRLGNKIKENNNTGSFVEVTNGYGYQFIKPDSDITMLSEMIFGAVAMTFRGNSLKVHSITSPNRVMCTKVFPSPIVRIPRRKISNKSLEDLTGSSINSMSDYGSEVKFAIGTVPLDVPSINSVDSGIHVDSFLSNSCSSTCYCFSPRSSDYRSNSISSSSSSSIASLHRRFHRSLTTSLDFTGYYSRDGWTEEIHKKSAKRTKLGLAILISLDEVQEKEMSVFLFEHIAMIESMVERFKTCVEQAYIHNETFVHLMMEGTDNLKQWVWDLFCAPRLTTPIWHGLTINKTINNNLSITFLQDFCQLLALIDTKATNFFISTLVTAVLTHHLGWVNTILQNQNQKADFSGKFNDFSKSHPYNPLWAQLGDLYGALGAPLKVAKTIITASGPKKNDLVNKILNSLTYFIRCGIVEKKIINCDQNLESQEKDEVDDPGVLPFKEIDEKEEIISRLERNHRLDRRAASSALTDEQKRYNIKLQILEREMNNLKSRKTFHCEVINGNLGSPSGAEWENESDYPLPVTPPKSDPQSTLKQTSENQEINASCSYSQPSVPGKHTFLPKRSETFNDNFDNNISKKKQYCLKSSKTCFNLSSLSSNSDLNGLNNHQNSIEKVNSREFNPKVKRCCINSNGENNFIKSLNVNKTRLSNAKETRGILNAQEHKSPSNKKKVIFVVGEDEKLGLKKEKSPETIRKNENKNKTVNTTLIELTQHVPCKIVGRSQSFNLPAKRQTLDLFRRYSDSDRKLDSMRTSSKLSLQTNFYKTYETKEDKLISGHAMFEDYSTLSDEDAQEVKKEEKAEVEKEENSQKINKSILSFEDLDINELPLPSLLLEEIDSCFYGYPQTLFGGICDHYTSDLVLHGCNDLEHGWESSLRRDLILSAQHSVLDQQISEAVCIVANIESWDVQLVSSQTYLVDKPNSLGIRVGMSQLVANMLESLLYLWKLKFTPEHCLMHLESKLKELFMKSEALAEMLLGTEFCTMDLLTSSLDLEANDVPLLLAIASIHTPQLAQKYGVTFR